MPCDAAYALSVLPLAEAAYDPSVMPLGWSMVAAIQPDDFGFIFRREKTVCIAIRGTQTAHEWLQDFDGLAVPSRYTPVGNVHRGFQDVYGGIRQSIITALPSDYDRLIITGHSLGAALALLCAAHLTTIGHPASQVVTFAGPRVGWEAWASWYGKQLGSITTRVVNRLDIVCDVPSAILGYRHVGDGLLVDGAGPIEAHYRHSLHFSYGPGLQKLIPKPLAA